MVAAKVSINQSQYLVMENAGTLSGSIMMDKVASENVTVQVAFGNGSAKGNIWCNSHNDNDLWYTAREDYANSTSQVFNVTISAGSTSSLFSIDIVNDMIQESNETFNITIKLFTSCLSISLGNSSARVTIIDDDGMMILKQNITAL